MTNFNDYVVLSEEQLSQVNGGKMTGSGLWHAIVGGAVAGGFTGMAGGPGGAFVGAHLGAAAGAIEYAFSN
jgi:lactobin A/cerein 7B family class IIb bacteriocin